MSCYYKSLPWLIPQLLLLARPGSEIILVSPWIDNVTLYPPLFGQGEYRYKKPEIKLGELLLYLRKNFHIRTTLVVREWDNRLERTVRSLSEVERTESLVHLVPFLHAKALITEAFVLSTSANFLYTSLFRNVELCSVVSNKYKNPRKWLKTKLNLTI